MVVTSTHRILNDAGHYIQFDRPDAVIAAIQEVVQSIRTETSRWLQAKESDASRTGCFGNRKRHVRGVVGSAPDLGGSPSAETAHGPMLPLS